MWNRIVCEKKFQSQVLVTTSALDVGIDILDPAVQNIAIMADNRTALLQMAGRRRIQGEELVNLWVCDLSKAALSSRYRGYTAQLRWFERLPAAVRQSLSSFPHGHSPVLNYIKSPMSRPTLTAVPICTR